MTGNSVNAKTWLVTIVTGFLAIGCSIKDLDWWLLLAIIPIVVFWYIDAYYLSLERALRNRLVPMVGNNPTLSIPFHV